ncbi:response regulator [Paenibacillus lemnae]|uniref:Response regulator n=1 Tax=Paenibacillus lemnae TaxID=1330551 RepID=A0A848M2E6_PAELE|nr:response regulator [Paenibacillus lemnae]NMO95067.1 response regulator [Paenibacillus lemnae]
MNILLVDDESYVTESLYQTIPWDSLGVSEVHQAVSALEAIDLLEEREIDIVVTDIRMPDMTGLELIETITERWTQVRCILLTGYSDFEYAKQAIRLQAADYILKPVDDEEFIQSVESAAAAIREEREELEKIHHLRYSRKTDLAILRTTLMHDLVLGRNLPRTVLHRNLEDYEIPLHMDKPAVMLLIQLGTSFTGMDDRSITLMEYAIGNIAEEIFRDCFRVWPGKAPHHGMILLVQGRSDPPEYISPGLLEPCITLFQQSVSSYLKGEIFVWVTETFLFPAATAEVYRAGLERMYTGSLRDGPSAGAVTGNHSRQPDRSMQAVHSLAHPPSLLHLLESSQWDQAREKLDAAFAQIENASSGRMPLYELFLSVANACMYIAHKRGYDIHQLDQASWDPLYIQQIVQSVPKLKAWSHDMLQKLGNLSLDQVTTSKSHMIKQVQEMVTTDSGHDLSVKTIADRVFLHPVYLSKIYKSETGEGLGDYIIRKRMERAVYLLKHTNKKIYEITAELGYQNPQYFSKMFRKHYGMTPNEYRDQG